MTLTQRLSEISNYQIRLWQVIVAVMGIVDAVDANYSRWKRGGCAGASPMRPRHQQRYCMDPNVDPESVRAEAVERDRLLGSCAKK